MTALLLTMGMAVGVMVWKTEIVSPPAVSGIVVLPFENLNPETKTQFFRDLSRRRFDQTGQTVRTQSDQPE